MNFHMYFTCAVRHWHYSLARNYLKQTHPCNKSVRKSTIACSSHNKSSLYFTTTPRYFHKGNSRAAPLYNDSQPEKLGMLKKVGKSLKWHLYVKAKRTVSSILIYEACADNIDVKEFFSYFKMQDTFLSWFLIIELHVWMCLARMMAEKAEGRHVRNQIVAAMWKDVQTRINKLGKIGSRTRKEGLQDLAAHFNAAILSYDEGLQNDDTVLAAAVWRIFFCYNCNDPCLLETMVSYIRKQNNATTNNADEPEISPEEASLMRKILQSKLIHSTHDVEIQRRDPNSPLYSVKSFEELSLHPELLRGVYEMGFNAPSKIQETTLPTLLADPPQNMIAQSQSGTGKTAAFILASLSRVDPDKHYPQVLVLSPTYELAQQTGSVAKQMAKFCPEIGFRFAVRGEEFLVERGEKIKEQVIIGTPGKVLDWSIRFKFFDVQKVKVFVLDEADVMIAMQGHHDQSIRIHKKLSQDCQMMLFSATYTEEVMEFAEIIVPNPVVLRLRKEDESLENIKQYYVVCRDREQKFSALANIYGVLSIGQAIIFCHTRQTAAWLSEKMTKDGHAVALLTGTLSIEQRISVLNRFRQAKEKVLITTNVCARGIDIEQVTVVVNFDLPVDQKGRADCETYLHRIGRTGRFGKSGLAINMVDGERTMRLLREIENHFGRKITRLDAEDVDEIEKIGRE